MAKSPVNITLESICKYWLWYLAFYCVIWEAQSFAQRNPAPRENGSLKIYPSMTQVGTVANREYKDAQGRVVKGISYRAKKLTWNPRQLREEDLVVQSSRLSEYGDGPNPVRTIFFRHDDTKDREVIREAGKDLVTWKYYDQTGTVVVAYEGHLKADAELPHGWGETRKNIRCGIALNKPAGSTAGRYVYITFQNLGDTAVQIEDLDLEIRDSSGNLVPSLRIPSTKKLALKSGFVTEVLSRPLDVAPSEARYQPCCLSDWFWDVPRGEYSLIAKAKCGNNTLFSNPVALRLTSRWNYHKGVEYDVAPGAGP